MNNKIFKLIICFTLLLLCTPSFGAKWRAKHVVFIGLDGWGAYSMEKANMPTVKQLMKDGSYTLEKRSVLPSSSAVTGLLCSWGQVRNYTDTPNGVQKHRNSPREYLAIMVSFQASGDYSETPIRKQKSVFSVNGTDWNIWQR